MPVRIAGIGAKRPRAARLGSSTVPKTHARTSDPRPNQRFRDHRLLSRLFEKDV